MAQPAKMPNAFTITPVPFENTNNFSPAGKAMEIKLSNERKKEIIEDVQSYFRNEFNEDIGDLKSEMFVDFLIEKLGAKIYNQAISDAYSFIQDKLIDLESILYIPE
jgi:uncharacterized protein (DUF2164 family)